MRESEEAIAQLEYSQHWRAKWSFHKGPNVQLGSQTPLGSTATYRLSTPEHTVFLNSERSDDLSVGLIFPTKNSELWLGSSIVQPSRLVLGASVSLAPKLRVMAEV